MSSDPYINCYNACTGGGGPNWNPANDGTVPYISGNVMLPCYNGTPTLVASSTVNNNLRPQWNSGPMHLNSSNTFANLTDGSSNCILIGETAYVGITDNYPGALWVWSSAGRNSSNLPVVFNSAAVMSGMNKPTVDMTWAIVQQREGASNGHSMMQLGFSSWHVGGGHVVMGDGSVRFISENTDLATQQKLGNMQDGNVLGAF